MRVPLAAAALAGVVAVVATAVAGCADTADDRAGQLVVSEVTMPDGSSLWCVSNGNTYSGGLSCGWAGR